MSEKTKHTENPEAEQESLKLYLSGLVDSLKFNDEEKRSVIALRRHESVRRLKNSLEITEVDSIFQNLVEDVLVTVYQYDPEIVETMSEIVKQRLARALLGRDLLYREFYDDDGEVSLYAGRYFPGIDPEDFDTYGSSWPAIWQEIKRKNIRVYSADPMENYAYVHGVENVIVLPFRLEVNETGVTLEYETEFQAPYGGESADRTVYFRRRDEMKK